ncbi:MAG TPA: hypothetical protein DIW81_09530 [Planctomycetaceae bacterium]|nr:hypothetical protein [Rubinisphaera sp.]HCS51818.1 hypothetical protein [Planctomycetaceae bacterium]
MSEKPVEIQLFHSVSVQQYGFSSACFHANWWIIEYVKTLTRSQLTSKVFKRYSLTIGRNSN